MNPQESLNLFKKTKGQEGQEVSAIKIESLTELYELIEHLKPDDKIDNAESIVINSKNTDFSSDLFQGSIVIPQSGGMSTVRKTLLEGFEMVKRHRQMYSRDFSEVEELFGGYLPARLPTEDNQISWLDRFVERRLGGRREGLYIIWDFDNETYRMDPWTCKLEKIND